MGNKVCNGCQPCPSRWPGYLESLKLLVEIRGLDVERATSDDLGFMICDGDIQCGCLSQDRQEVEVSRCVDDFITIEVQSGAAGRHHVEVICQVRGVRLSRILIEQLKSASMNDECSPQRVAAEGTSEIGWVEAVVDHFRCVSIAY